MARHITCDKCGRETIPENTRILKAYQFEGGHEIDEMKHDMCVTCLADLDVELSRPPGLKAVKRG